jgi:hypothetical protein
VKDLKNKKSALDFLLLIFSSFFRRLWVAIPVIALIASWRLVPQEGILLTPLMFRVLVLIGSILLVLILSTGYQGWLIYQKPFTRLRVVGFQKCDDYGGDRVFLLEGNIGVAQGTVLELKRFHAGVEVTMALVGIIEENSKGQYQAIPIWISPGHLLELRTGQLPYSEIEAEPSVKLRTLEKAKDEIKKYGDTGEIKKYGDTYEYE